MESAFLKLAAGSRLTNYMGLKMTEGHEFKYGHQYMYVEIPIKEIYNPSEEKVVTKAMRNQHVRIIPACTVHVRGRHTVEIEPNSRLSEYGTISGGIYRVHSDGPEMVPGFYITLRRDLDISDIEWAVRLYLIP